MPNENTGNVAKNGLDMILSRDLKDFNKTFIESLFAAYHDRQTNTFKEAPFSPRMSVLLTPNVYPYVKEPTKTSLGMLVFNRYVLERTGIIKHTGYWNTTLNKKGANKLNTTVTELLVLDKITAEDLGNFIDSRDAIGFWCCAFLGVSATSGLIRPMADVNKRKDELFEQYKDKLNSDSPVVRLMATNNIEAELMKMVKNNLQNDPGYDLYESGVGDLSYNYKKINVMGGAIYNEQTENFDVIKNSLMEGMTKKDIPACANSVVAGAYPSAVGTAEAGYLSKIILAVLQDAELDADADSDCGTRATIPLTITNSNKQYVLYRNIVVDGKKYLTTLENIDKFVGKTVQLYSPMGCLNDKICGKCGGRVFHNLGVTKVGLLTTEITQKLLNLKLKSKHNLSQNASFIDKNKILLNHQDLIKIDENGNVVNKQRMRLFVPKLMESQSVFDVEATRVTCMGVMPVKFYDKDNNEIASTLMTVPTLLTFHLYSDVQETADEYVISYEADSIMMNVAIRESLANVEYFLNQIYLYSKQAIIPYNLITELMFRCLEINHIDLNGPSITYELLARKLCRNQSETDTFAKDFGRNPNIDQKSYKKIWFREAVMQMGPLSAILFQDISAGLNTGLAMTLEGKEPIQTPLEKIIKA